MENLLNIEYKENVEGKFLSTYRGGGVVKYVAYPKTIGQIREVIAYTKNVGIPFFILGNGSNILIRDIGYKGVAISLKHLDKLSVYKNKIYAGSGAMLHKIFAEICLPNSLSGFERLAGIPTTVGGAIVGNAGAFGESIGDIVEYVDVIDYENDGIVTRLDKSQLDFAYRSSSLKGKNIVVLGGYFNLTYDKQSNIKEIYNYQKNRRINIQPQQSSLGSVFLNSGDICPARLIDSCGLKGLRIGGAEVSAKHANFIVNVGNGTATDYIRVMEKVQSIVYNEFGVTLHKEIRII